MYDFIVGGDRIGQNIKIHDLKVRFDGAKQTTMS